MRLEELSAMKKKERKKVPGLEEEKKSLEKLWREEPVVFGAPLNLRVDWFVDARSGGDSFKTWAGQQSVIDIAHAMKRPIEAGGWDLLPSERWLAHSAHCDGLPFNFDSDLGKQSSDLDVGFSFDPLKMKVRTRPFIELTAFIGLQRFRPSADPNNNRFFFSQWPIPLSPEVASAAACGLIHLPGTRMYEFRLLYRTKYLKSFLPANPLGESQ